MPLKTKNLFTSELTEEVIKHNVESKARGTKIIIILRTIDLISKSTFEAVPS